MEEKLQQSLTRLGQSLTLSESEALKTQMIEQVNWMILHRFERLVQMLYRLDIDEKKLRSLLAENSDVDAAALITQLIIQRELQKAASRKNTPPANDLSGEEPW